MDIKFALYVLHKIHSKVINVSHAYTNRATVSFCLGKKHAKIKRNTIALKCCKKATMFYRWAKAH